MGPEGEGMKRGFILGKFMPPHAGHVTLIDAAQAMVDELTILLCSLPGDPIPGEERLEWMRRLFPELPDRLARRAGASTACRQREVLEDLA